MALTTNLNDASNLVQLGNRNDFCYLCAKEVTANTEREYSEKIRALKGKLEGRKCVKLKMSGSEVSICLEHIHKISKENPIE